MNNYYKLYYQNKKHIYKYNYEENKRKKKEEEELYKNYGGERAYYRAKILEFVKIIKKD